MTIDVLADPRVVKGRPIKGGIITGSFLLTGRTDVELRQMVDYINQRQKSK